MHKSDFYARQIKSNSQVPFGLALRFAVRELRGGVKGFYIFLACLVLGVTAIAGVGSVSRALTEGIRQSGTLILGGDIAFELIHREASSEELAFIQELGSVSQVANLRAMARRSDGADQTLVELKAVDQVYPLVGRLQTSSEKSLDLLIGRQNSDNQPSEQLWGAVAAPELLARLNLSVGQTVQVGNLTLLITDELVSEPDQLATGFGFGPRLLVAEGALRESGLIQPGSLINWIYRVVLPPSMNSDAALDRIITQAETRFPLAGWDIDSRRNASPGLQRNIERFAQFLTLVGLAALMVGGVGIANAVQAFLDTKHHVIAVFKSLGAGNSLVFRIYLFQIMILASLGIMFGLILGALTPMAVTGVVQSILKIELAAGIYPQELLFALFYGVLTAFVFALLPLSRAHNVPPTQLFRSHLFKQTRLPPWPYLLSFCFAVIMLAVAAVFFSYDRFVASVFVGASIMTFILLRLIADIVMKLFRHLPSPRSTPWRLALGNIHRKGALTPSVILSLGLGLALLVCLTLIDSNLRRQLSTNIPDQAPSFFFLDIQNEDLASFQIQLADIAPTGQIQTVPMLRGRLISLKGVPVQQIEPSPAAAWVLRGDRGITYSSKMPENSTLKDGQWWPVDYQGESLVSFDAELAVELDLGIGDQISVNVLGRQIDARIANLRSVEWESLSINFVMVFSPNTFAGAPHTHLATLTYPQTTSLEEEFSVLKTMTSAFPTVTTVRVKDALDQANSLLGQLALAVRLAASIALIASVFVLAGALAAGQRNRAYDAVILKTLGATRVTLIQAFIIEYIILGTITAIFGLIAGSLASWFVLEFIMDIHFVFLAPIAGFTLVIALLFTIGFGLLGTWKLLGQKAALMLREL